MTKITQIKQRDELLKCWPRLYTLATKEYDSVLNPEHLLQLYLTCFSYGALFAVRNDTGLCGLVAVEADPNLTGTLLLRAIPNDYGTGRAKECMRVVKEWAIEHDYTYIKVSSKRLSGSRFHYFEKTLGFRRYSVTFKMKL